jgi:hypothetical protein
MGTFCPADGKYLSSPKNIGSHKSDKHREEKSDINRGDLAIYKRW